VATDQPDAIGRKELLNAILIALAAATVVVGLYYLVPISRPHEPVLVQVAVGVAIVGVVLAHEIRAILRHDAPMARGLVSLAIVIPLFIVLFALIYFSMAHSDASAFGEPLSRTAALYFTITVLSTVGFGDITPKTDLARIAVSAQMVADAVLLVVAVRLILRSATKRTTQVRAEREGTARP